MPDGFHKGDIGSVLVIHITEDGVDFDVSSQTTMQIKLKPRSNEALKTFAAAYAVAPNGNGLGTDGKIQYVTVSTGDLDQIGAYDVQAYLVLPGLWTGHTQSATFTVGDTL